MKESLADPRFLILPQLSTPPLITTSYKIKILFAILFWATRILKGIRVGIGGEQRDLHPIGRTVEQRGQNLAVDNEEEVSCSESCYWPRLATRLCGSNWPRNSRSFVLVNGHPPWNKRGQSRKWNCRITALCSTTRQTSHVFVQTSLHWLKRYFHSGCKRFSNGENQIWDTAWHVGNARIRWRHEAG